MVASQTRRLYSRLEFSARSATIAIVTMDQIRTLIWLKTRFTLALYRKRRSLLVILLVSLPLTLAFNLALFFGGLVAFWSLPLENSRQLLSGALTAIYLMWLMGPLLGVSMNEGYDISKLLQFPISGKRIFLANILGSALEPTVLFLMIPLASIPIGLATGLGTGALMVGVLLLFLFHTISLSQALLTLLWGLLKSRRVADFWKVFVALAGTIFWVTYQVAIRRLGNVAPTLVMAKPGRFTQFLPSGLAADAIVALRSGVTSDFAWRAALLAAICVATVALAGSLVQRVAAGDLILDKVGLKTPPKRTSASQRHSWHGPAWLSSLTAAMIQNELRIFFRDPQAKADLLRRSGSLIAMPLVMLSSRGSLSIEDMRHVGVFLFIAPMGAMVLLMLVMTSNILARDRNGLSLLFTMPAPRESILVGKNAAMLAIFSPVCAIIVIAIAGLIAQWALLAPALIITECLMVMSTAIGNVFSVYNPMPLPEKGRNPYTAGQGCALLGCAASVAGFCMFAIIALPLVPAFIVPAKWVSPEWFALSLPAAVAYTAVAYYLLTKWAARAMTRREPEILRVILKLPA